VNARSHVSTFLGNVSFLRIGIQFRLGVLVACRFAFAQINTSANLGYTLKMNYTRTYPATHWQMGVFR